MTLDEIIRKRGPLVSWSDLVEWMKEFDAVRLYTLALRIGHSESMREYSESKRTGGARDPDFNPERLNEMVDYCDAMGFRVAAASLREAESLRPKLLKETFPQLISDVPPELHKTPINDRYSELMRQFRRSFKIEASGLKVLYIQPDRVFYWNDSDKDGEGNAQPCHIDGGWRYIFAKLPQETKDDVVRAGKCFAYSEYTASAIHLCRAMECGFKAFAKKHNIESNYLIENTSWEKLADSIKDHIVKHTATITPAERKMFNKVKGQIIILKDQWRNPSAHSGGVFYDDEELLQIYHTVKGILTDITSNL